MRLGSKIAIAGIVLLALGLSQPAVHENTTTDCSGFSWEPCETHTTYEPNHLRSFMVIVGGFMFSTGTAAWLGTADAERRQRRREAEKAREENLSGSHPE